MSGGKKVGFLTEKQDKLIKFLLSDKRFLDKFDKQQTTKQKIVQTHTLNIFMMTQKGTMDYAALKSMVVPYEYLQYMQLAVAKSPDIVYLMLDERFAQYFDWQKQGLVSAYLDLSSHKHAHVCLKFKQHKLGLGVLSNQSLAIPVFNDSLVQRLKSAQKFAIAIGEQKEDGYVTKSIGIACPLYKEITKQRTNGQSQNQYRQIGI